MNLSQMDKIGSKLMPVFLAIIVGCFFALSSADYEDEKRQERIYCKNVAEGVWPHYNKSINCDKE